MGGDTIHTVSVRRRARQAARGLHLALDNEVYSVDEYPASARLLEAGSGSFVARVDDQSADRAERTLLELLGRTSVLAAAAADHEVTWLLELYADSRTAPLEEGVVEAALLLRAAIPPRSAHKDAALRKRWRAPGGPDQRARRTARAGDARAGDGGGGRGRAARGHGRATPTALIRVSPDGTCTRRPAPGCSPAPR